MTKWLTTVTALALCVALAACGENGGDHADAGHDDHDGHDHGTEVEPAPIEVEQPDEPAVAMGEFPQATIDGTMTLFVDALSKGEYQFAMDVCDETSIEVQEQFGQRAENLTYPHPNPNVPEDVILALRDIVSKPYQGAQWSVSDEGAEEAIVQLTLVDGRSSDLTLVNKGGAWFVFPYEGFLDWAEQSVAGNMQNFQGGGS